MEEVNLNDAETRFYSELFNYCDVEKTGKVAMLKATELFRSADIPNEIVLEILSLAGIPATALHISRAQFYSCLKLIAAYQAGKPLRPELIVATVQLPLPHFSWQDEQTAITSSAISSISDTTLGILPPPPPTDRRNSLRRNSQQQEQQQQQQMQLQDASDVPSTDSEVEQNESSCGGEYDGADDGPSTSKGIKSGCVGLASSNSREMKARNLAGGGSPEAWSTNSDSPTPTNSVAERPWAQDPLWEGLLGDEHRQLLGTEEESSDRDEEDNESVMAELFKVAKDQKRFYLKCYRYLPKNSQGLIAGPDARVFFERSRLPVEDLRYIWQLADVTQDGFLSLAEFGAAMQLIVVRRHHFPLPTTLPEILQPHILGPLLALPLDPPEGDLLHLNDEQEDDHADNTITGSANVSGAAAGSRNVMNMSSISTSSQTSTSSRRERVPSPPPPVKNRSISNSPSVDKEVNKTPPKLTAPAMENLWTLPPTPPTVSNTLASLGDTNSSNLWTKFSESPTTSARAAAKQAAKVPTAVVPPKTQAPINPACAPAVSSPGLKPALFDMKRTAQDVGSNPQILHPVPLRVTPIGGGIANSGTDTSSTQSTNDTDNSGIGLRENSPKAAPPIISGSQHQQHQQAAMSSSMSGHQRDSIQNSDLRAIQRPQPKKLLAKNVGALPPPPQREPSIGSSSGVMGGGQMEGPPVAGKKEPPPLPPPRPHRHARSSSLDLNKFKMGTAGAQQAEESSEQQQSLPPIGAAAAAVAAPPPLPAIPSGSSGPPLGAPARISLQGPQRVSAFEVYRKPNTPRNSQSPPGPLLGAVGGNPQPPPPNQPPPPAPFGAGTSTGHLPNADHFERRLNAITESMRHITFRNQTQGALEELLHHLREQNTSVNSLCNDLSDELYRLTLHRRELQFRLDSLRENAAAEAAAAVAATSATGGASLTAHSDSPGAAVAGANVSVGSAGSGDNNEKKVKEKPKDKPKE